MTIKILIEVGGGVVQKVSCNEPAEVTLVDTYDIKEECETDFVFQDNYLCDPLTDQLLAHCIDEANKIVSENILFINGEKVKVVTDEDERINY